jgi:hypothetical protein
MVGTVLDAGSNNKSFMVPASIFVSSVAPEKNEISLGTFPDDHHSPTYLTGLVRVISKVALPFVMYLDLVAETGGKTSVSSSGPRDAPP